MTKNRIYLGLAATALLALNACNRQDTSSSRHEAYAAKVAQHPVIREARNFHDTGALDQKGPRKGDRPDLAFAQNFEMTMDPALGYPTPSRLKQAWRRVQQLRSSSKVDSIPELQWEERGPRAVGGRTRAMMFDPNDSTHSKVWAGGVSGGLWYTDNIANRGSQWNLVDDFWRTLSVSAIAYDPTDLQTFYVGTGEGQARASIGEGVWKTTDAGQSWTQLSSTTSMRHINDLVVREENGQGVLYVAVRNDTYEDFQPAAGVEGLYRSTDGGSSFSQVLPSVPGESYPYAIADLEIGADNRLWLGTIESTETSGNRGGGDVLFTDDGLNYTLAKGTNGDRVELAVAPSDAGVIYALIEKSSTIFRMQRSLDSGATWQAMARPDDADPGIPANDFTRGQAWYDLIAQVDPNDPYTVVVGGVDLFRSQDTANSWQQLSHWYGGFGFPKVHADQHQFLFAPGSSQQVISGSDGGVYYSGNFTSSFPAWRKRNLGYNVTQFYAAAMHPAAGEDEYLAGSQDNGTQQFTQPGLGTTREATGGDGGFCFIDQDEAHIQITSYVYNNFYQSTNGGRSFNSLNLNNSNSGRFINPADYDDSLNILYSPQSAFKMNRIKNFGGSIQQENFRLRNISSVPSALKVSPYQDSTTTLYVGTGAGSLLRIRDADGSFQSPQIDNITGTQFPAGYISSIDVGASEQELLVTFSNYGVTSVWYTSDGGSTWQSREGDLPDMPIRGALFNPRNREMVILATELGVWSTRNFKAAQPSWIPSNKGLANVRVDQLQLRSSDYGLAAATHGRGLFTSAFPSGVSLPEREANSALEVQVFPNPAQDYVRVSLATASAGMEVKARLLQLDGRTVEQWKWQQQKGKEAHQLQLPSLAAGTYLLQVEAGNQSTSRRLLLER